MGRLAIVDHDKCKPTKCGKRCALVCPPNQQQKACIVIEDIEDIGKKAVIYTDFCIGCGLCVKNCPFNAIHIVNVPQQLTSDKLLYSYGQNKFRVYSYPSIRKGICLGILGGNGLGKSTLMKLLTRELTINLKDKKSLLAGTELYNFLSNDRHTSYKPQDVIAVQRSKHGQRQVSEVLDKLNVDIQEQLDLTKLKSRLVKELSGGEIQRLLIGLACSKDADAYLFDEPSAFLDIKQRIVMAKMIESKIEQKYVILVEHDLCIFDYISDSVVCLYGQKGAYGVVSTISNTFNGINNYLEGYLPSENMQIRDKPIRFKSSIEDDDLRRMTFKYASTTKTFDGFQLNISAGEFSTSEVILLIGENGTGKSTFIKMLAGDIKPDNSDWVYPDMHVSIKPQDVYDTSTNLTVQEYIFKTIGNMAVDTLFRNTVIKPLKIDDLNELTVSTLSGGQAQKVALVIALGKVADIYLLDEPSAYVDVDDRIVMAKVIRQFAYQTSKTVFLVEHDLIFATSISDKVIVFEGEPSVNCTARSPTTLQSGINDFLKMLDITMRRDITTGRPRINKKGSVLDQQQKSKNTYFTVM